MSISYGAALVVGLPYREVKEGKFKDDFEEDFEIGDIRLFHPSYDAPLRDCLIGVDVCGADFGEFSLAEIDDAAVDRAKGEFLEYVGQEPRLYITPDIT